MKDINHYKIDVLAPPIKTQSIHAWMYIHECCLIQIRTNGEINKLQLSRVQDLDFIEMKFWLSLTVDFVTLPAME